MTDEEPQIITKESTENENHETIPETSRNPEISRDTPTQNSPKIPEINPETDAQETHKTVNTRGTEPQTKLENRKLKSTRNGSCLIKNGGNLINFHLKKTKVLKKIRSPKQENRKWICNVLVKKNYAPICSGKSEDSL